MTVCFIMRTIIVLCSPKKLFSAAHSVFNQNTGFFEYTEQSADSALFHTDMCCRGKLTACKNLGQGIGQKCAVGILSRQKCFRQKRFWESVTAGGAALAAIAPAVQKPYLFHVEHDKTNGQIGMEKQIGNPAKLPEGIVNCACFRAFSRFGCLTCRGIKPRYPLVVSHGMHAGDMCDFLKRFQFFAHCGQRACLNFNDPVFI